MIITIDNVSFTLKKPHDFSWLAEYGTVFCVYDKQDSGNLLFGLEKNREKSFLKYAGARTTEYDGEPGDAIRHLKSAAKIYEQIRHPSLVNMQSFHTVPHGAFAVFDWFEGRGMHEHWAFDQVPKAHPASPYSRYRSLPMGKRLKSLEEIFQFHCYVEQMGFVAVDFYDGSIMYDFERDITKVCDIDFYRRKPAHNDMGKDFYGTKRLKAPEEYTYGAVIDSDTTVFTLGALILHLFGQYSERDIARMYQQSAFFPCSRDGWVLSRHRYEIARKAVQHSRELRYRSVEEFYQAWKE